MDNSEWKDLADSYRDHVIALQEFYTSRLARIDEKLKQINEEHLDDKLASYNYYGGWTKGYFEGLKQAYQFMLEDLSLIDKK